MSTSATDHPGVHHASGAGGLADTGPTPRPPATGAHRACACSWGRQAQPLTLRQHAAAWRETLRTGLPNQGALSQKIQRWAASWAIVLSMRSARALLALGRRSLPRPLHAQYLPSIFLMDRRGPPPARLLAEARRARRGCASQAEATVQPMAPLNEFLGWECSSGEYL